MARIESAYQIPVTHARCHEHSIASVRIRGRYTRRRDVEACRANVMGEEILGLPNDADLVDGACGGLEMLLDRSDRAGGSSSPRFP
jgi:hypothetical protein